MLMFTKIRQQFAPVCSIGCCMVYGFVKSYSHGDTISAQPPLPPNCWEYKLNYRIQRDSFFFFLLNSLAYHLWTDHTYTKGPSSETQGQLVEAEESQYERKNEEFGEEKSSVEREEKKILNTRRQSGLTEGSLAAGV